MAASGGLLLTKGLWQPLWICVMVFVFSPLLFPMIMIPAAFFSGAMQAAQQPAPRLAKVLHIASVGYLVLVLSFWTEAAFDSVSLLTAAGGYLKIAGLVWALSGTVAPWAVFARNDRDNLFFTSLVLMLQVSSLACAALLIADTAPAAPVFWTSCAVLTALSCAQAFYESRLDGPGKQNAPF
jgi:hypothetical protein